LIEVQRRKLNDDNEFESELFITSKPAPHQYAHEKPTNFGDQNAAQAVTVTLLHSAWVHNIIITVTAILIGLFIELRFHDAWSLYIW